MAANPANASARNNAQCTRLRRLMAAIPLTSVNAAKMAKTIPMKSIGKTIRPVRELFGAAQRAPEADVGYPDHRRAQQPAGDQGAGETPHRREVPDGRHHQVQ